MPPQLFYWHLWTDTHGISRHSKCVLDQFTLHHVGNAAAQWNNAQPRGDSTIVFTVQPVGWVGSWHENPAPQWIVPLSGAWWVEAMDGTRISFGPGEISLGEDQNCRPDAAGRFGHRSGTIGDQPAVLMTVQLHRPPVQEPGHFR
ncbi:MAG: cupin domain-containing protein [Acidocella sp.]|nr:cupin domain-containing protein [Acidocella sp.]